MVRLIQKGRFPLIGGGHSVLSWIALEDAASAVARAVESPSPEAVYNVVDDEPVSFADYASEMANHLRAKSPGKVPKWLVRPFASYATVFMDDVRLPVSNARLKRDFNWQPAFPIYRSVLATLPAALANETNPSRAI
jgi:nucleoside-diphosphate-sugar epimerase